MRFGRTLFAVLVAVGLAGCGSDGGITSPKSAPLDFHDGFAKLDVPLSARREETVAVGGGRVFVFGGTQKNGGLHFAADGVIYDIERHTWSPVPDPPFRAPLAHAQAAWDGREFVVLGSPCADPKQQDDSLECGGAPQAAAFDPRARRWRTVALPDLSDGAGAGFALSSGAVGRAGGRAVFEYDVSGGTALVALNSNGPGRKMSPPPGVTRVCALDALFAFGASAGGAQVSVVPAPPGSVDPTHTWTYRDGAWVDGGGFGPSTTPTYGERTICTPSAVGFVPSTADGLGLGGPVGWFEPATGWQRLPPVTEVPAHITAATVARQADVPLVWIGDRISLLRDGVWSERSTEGYRRLFPWDSAGSKLVGPYLLPALAEAGRYLVGDPYSDAWDRPALVFVDPAALRPAG